MNRYRVAFALLALVLVGPTVAADDEKWVSLFNGKDTTGWKIREDKITVTKFFDAEGKVIADARKGKVDQKDEAQDAKGKAIADAKIVDKDGKKVVVDAEGKPIAGAKVAKVGGRDAIVGKDGKEIAGAKAVAEKMDNTNGWIGDKGILVCEKPHHGNDLLTEQKFTDFELHVEFVATSNSGVYLQGRYEIQVNNDVNAKPKIVEKDGKKIEMWDSHQCGALYGRIAPSKNMSKPPSEWQTFDITFHAPRGEKGKVAQKGRVTLIWNGEKVIDNAEIDGVTGGALDNNVTDPGPILLQGDHGKVSFRNIKIRPLPAGK
jgi:hypothetical protein